MPVYYLTKCNDTVKSTTTTTKNHDQFLFVLSYDSFHRFAVNFITSVSDLYFKEIGCDIATPPGSLIELITEWISDNPDLCSQEQPSLDLPAGAIPMAMATPTEGLIRWCTLSSLFLPLNDLIYSKLHLAVLQSLTQVSRNETNYYYFMSK